jgi:hypothetical protein
VQDHSPEGSLCTTVRCPCASFAVTERESGCVIRQIPARVSTWDSLSWLKSQADCWVGHGNEHDSFSKAIIYGLDGRGSHLVTNNNFLFVVTSGSTPEDSPADLCSGYSRLFPLRPELESDRASGRTVTSASSYLFVVNGKVIPVRAVEALRIARGSGYFRPTHGGKVISPTRWISS